MLFRSPPGTARLAVVLNGPAGAHDVCRVEAADRVMRVWALLKAADSELHQVRLPRAAVGRLHRQLQAITTELAGAMSGKLADELDRLARPSEVASPTVAELRIEYACLLGWVSGLVTGMLSELEQASTGTGPSGQDALPRSGQGGPLRPAGPNAAKTSTRRSTGSP